MRQHQTILVEFARVSAEITDLLQRLLAIACQHAARAIGVQHSKVLQYRGDKGDLLMVAGKGWKPGTVGHARFGADMLSPPGRCYQIREPVSIGTINDDLRVSLLVGSEGARDHLSPEWPDCHRRHRLGVLEVDSTEPNAFDGDDQEFLTAFSLILALAFRHRQGQSERERRAEEMGKRLAQAETYMQEQNHRVRNYFQMILSILASRSRRAANEQSRTELEEVMERVTAVGLAHDLLTVESG